MATMRIILADDHVMFREGMHSFIERLSPDVEIVDAGSLDDVLGALSPMPQLILLDLRMPGMTGPASIAEVKRRAPDVPVVILSAVIDRTQMADSIHAGASGYIPKRLSGAAMISALQLVLSGERFVPFLMLSEEANPEVRSPSAPLEGHPASLTRREREIMTLLKDGLPNKIIASRLDVSEVTVKSHLCSIFRKMGVQNRVQAIRCFTGI